VLVGAGATLVVASLGFIAVFSYLASAFGYPDVLDRGAAEVLPRLLAGGPRLRLVWFLYAALPLGIVFAAAASSRILERGGRGLAGFGTGAGVAAGIAMTLGLVRWPTIQWALAQEWKSASDSSRAALSAFFDAANSYLGNVIGEFAGEAALATWFITLGVVFRRTGRDTLGAVGIAAGLLVAVAALRNMTSLVDPVSALNNVTLPLWLITLGVVFVRHRAPSPAPP
jgi:hypothetical protein